MNFCIFIHKLYNTILIFINKHQANNMSHDSLALPWISIWSAE